MFSSSDPLAAEAIGTDFVPRPSEDVQVWPVGDEAVLFHSKSGTAHALNPPAALTWQCFDGDSSLEDIVADLAEGFGVPADAIRDDVLSMVRSAGAAGLLEGVEPTRQISQPQLTGLAEGEPVRVPGRSLSAEGRRSLLVNWSATCGFCELILTELAALGPALSRCGVDIVLVDTSDGRASRHQLDEHGLEVDIVAGRAAASVIERAFCGMGTPVAYLLDEESRVGSPLAYGAPNVLELARSLVTDSNTLGNSQPDEVIPRFIPVSGGVCGPSGSSAPARDWQPTRAYVIGEYTVGIRANSAFADRIVAEALVAQHVPDVAAPDNFSVVLGEKGQSARRQISLLVSGNKVVARSRYANRVVHALASHLSCLLAPQEGLFRLDAVGALLDGRAVLLPKAVLSWLERLQAPLARMGFSVADEPFAHIDVTKRELVVAAPRVSFDESALRDLAGVAPEASEPGVVPPGRYQLDAWLLPVRNGLPGPLAPAAAVAGALGELVADPAEVQGAVESFISLMGSVDAVSVLSDDPGALLEAVRNWRNTEP